jgi:putative flippase GtrA
MTIDIDSDRIRRIVTFGVIGAFNTGAFFILATLFNYALNSEAASAYLAYAMLLPVSFLGHRRLTFRSEGLISREWIRFCVIQGINVAVIWLVTHTLSGWISFAMISGLIPILNFLVFQIWVFTPANRD